MSALFVGVILSALVTVPALACGPGLNAPYTLPTWPPAAALDKLLPNAKLADDEMIEIRALRAEIAKLIANRKMKEVLNVEVKSNENPRLRVHAVPLHSPYMGEVFAHDDEAYAGRQLTRAATKASIPSVCFRPPHSRTHPMRHLARTAAALLAFLVPAATLAQGAPDATAARSIAAAYNATSDGLMRQFAAKPGNIVFSPAKAINHPELLNLLAAGRVASLLVPAASKGAI